MTTYLENYERWLASDRLSEKERDELLAIRQNEDEIRDCFSCYLSFGTAGLDFAKTAACVLAEAGIKAYLFDALRPTPELSFALRELGCVAGINITASHNPKQYNGYKAYWDDGAQLPPEHADTVAASMQSLDIFNDVRMADYDTALSDGRIELLGADMDYIAPNAWGKTYKEQYGNETVGDFL